MSRQPGAGPTVVAAGLAACVGAGLAMGVLTLVHSFGEWKLLIVLMGAVVVLSVLAAALVPASPVEPAEPQHSWQPAPSGAGWPAGPVRRELGRASSWPAATVPTTSPSTSTPEGRASAGRPTPLPAIAGVPAVAGPPSSVALRVQGGGTSPDAGPWWEATAAGTSGKGAGQRPAPDEPGSSDPTVDLATYSGVTRIVQCPRCGDFRVDVRQQDSGFAFTCRRCAHPWQWRPGSPWPATVVRPRTAAKGPSDTGRASADPT